MSIFSRFAKMFEKQDKSILGIDIGSSSIKVVQLRKKGEQAVLETYGELALGPYAGGTVGQSTNLPKEKIIEALNDLLNEKEVNVTTKSVALAIPFSSSLMSLIQVPDVQLKELQNLIPIEARKYIPIPITEVSLDWSIIPRDDTSLEDNPENAPILGKPKEKTIDVLLVAIHNAILEKYNSIITSVGLNASFFEIEIFSTMRAVLDETIAPVMIFDMGAATTKLYIVERGIVRLSHTINRGSHDITIAVAKSLGLPMDRAEVMKRTVGMSGSGDKNMTDIVHLSLDYVFSEANRVILNFERKYNKNLKKIIFVGGGSALKGLAELAQSNFETPVETADPFMKTEAPAFLEGVLKETGPEFAVAIGLALRKLREGTV